MSCELFGDLVIDVLYGEEVEPRQALQFHRHLAECDLCEKEYLELLETRELLGKWDFEGEQNFAAGIAVEDVTVGAVSRKGKSFWPFLQKAAAVVLVALGVVTILQGLGLIPRGNGGRLDEQAMTEILHELVVARQVEDWKVIGEALLTLKEEMEAENRLYMEAVYEDLNAIEERTVQILEESSQGGLSAAGQ